MVNSGTNVVTTAFAIVAGGDSDLVAGLNVIDNNDGNNLSAASFSTTDVAAYLAAVDANNDDIVLENVDDDVYIVVGDGTDAAIFKVVGSDDIENDVIDDGELTLIATLEGIADTGTLTAANFADFI